MSYWQRNQIIKLTCVSHYLIVYHSFIKLAHPLPQHNRINFFCLFALLGFSDFSSWFSVNNTGTSFLFCSWWFSFHFFGFLFSLKWTWKKGTVQTFFLHQLNVITYETKLLVITTAEKFSDIIFSLQYTIFQENLASNHPPRAFTSSVWQWHWQTLILFHFINSSSAFSCLRKRLDYHLTVDITRSY